MTNSSSSRQAVVERSAGSHRHSPRLLNLRQAAGYLGLSFWTVRDYVLAGLLPTVALPPLRAREGERPRSTLRRVLIDVEDLDRFIADHKANAAVLKSSALQNRPATTGRNQASVPAVCPREAVKKPEPRP